MKSFTIIGRRWWRIWPDYTDTLPPIHSMTSFEQTKSDTTFENTQKQSITIIVIMHPLILDKFQKIPLVLRFLSTPWPLMSSKIWGDISIFLILLLLGENGLKFTFYPMLLSWTEMHNTGWLNWDCESTNSPSKMDRSPTRNFLHNTKIWLSLQNI